MMRIAGRSKAVSALLVLLTCVSFIYVAHHHHGLAQPGEAAEVRSEPGAAGSGLLCHACILGGIPTTAAADRADARPDIVSTIDLVARCRPLPSADVRDSFDSRGPPVSV